MRLLNYAFIITMVFMLFMGEDALAAKRYSKYRWDDKQVIGVENRMGREWNAAVKFSVASWEKAFPRLDFRVIHRADKKGCAGEFGRIIICRSSPNGSWSGLSSIHTSRHEIHSVSIWIVNYKPRNASEGWRGSRTVSLWDVNTLCHELGHAVGLDHNTSRQSCLGNESLLSPGKFDRQSLKQLYRHEGKGWP